MTMPNPYPRLSRQEKFASERFKDDRGRRYWFLTLGDIYNQQQSQFRVGETNRLLAFLTANAPMQATFGNQLFYMELPRGKTNVPFPGSAGDDILYLTHHRTGATLRISPGTLLSPPKHARYGYMIGEQVTAMDNAYVRL